MTPQQLLALCHEPNGPNGETPKHLYLTVLKDRLPRGSRISIVGRGKPFGDICTVRDEGNGFAVTAVFERSELIELAERAIADD